MTTKNKKHPADRMTAKELSNRDALQRINHEARLVNGLQQALESAKDSAEVTSRYAYNFQYLPDDLVTEITDKITELEALLDRAHDVLTIEAKVRIRGMQA